jgi:ABC-type enterochelin transport system permease subunit
MAVVGMENKFNLDLLITYQRVKQIPVVAVAVVLEMVKMAVAA